MLTSIRTLALVAAIGLTGSFSVPLTALACGGESCAMCEGKASADPAEQPKVASKTTKSGRKLKCSKCGDHGEAKAGDASKAETPAT